MWYTYLIHAKSGKPFAKTVPKKNQLRQLLSDFLGPKPNLVAWIRMWSIFHLDATLLGSATETWGNLALSSTFTVLTLEKNMKKDIRWKLLLVPGTRLWKVLVDPKIELEQLKKTEVFTSKTLNHDYDQARLNCRCTMPPKKHQKTWFLLT